MSSDLSRNHLNSTASTFGCSDQYCKKCMRQSEISQTKKSSSNCIISKHTHLIAKSASLVRHSRNGLMVMGVSFGRVSRSFSNSNVMPYVVCDSFVEREMLVIVASGSGDIVEPSCLSFPGLILLETSAIYGKVHEALVILLIHPSLLFPGSSSWKHVYFATITNDAIQCDCFYRSCS